ARRVRRPRGVARLARADRRVDRGPWHRRAHRRAPGAGAADGRPLGLHGLDDRGVSVGGGGSAARTGGGVFFSFPPGGGHVPVDGTRSAAFAPGRRAVVLEREADADRTRYVFQAVLTGEARW